MEWTYFRQRLTELAPNDTQRASALGVSPRTVANWRNNRQMPRLLSAIIPHHELASALFVDLYMQHLSMQDTASIVAPDEQNDATS